MSAAMQVSACEGDRQVRSRFGGRVLLTPRAISAVHELSSAGGPQSLLIAWPGGVTALPSGCYAAGPYDAVIGHVVGCPLWVDLRRLAVCPQHVVVLDAPERTQPPRLPLLKVVAGLRP